MDGLRERQLQSLFEALDEGIVYIGLDGRIVQANPAAERILGLRRSGTESCELVSPDRRALRPDGTPMPPEEMAGSRAMREKRLVKDVVMGLMRPDGSISWINSIAAPIIKEAGELEGAVGTFSDITDRKQAEEALRESEARYRAIFNYAPIGIGHVDINGRTIETNRAIQGILWYSGEELHSMTIAEITHPDDTKIDLDNFRELISGKHDYYRMERRYYRKDGRLIWVNLAASIVRDAAGKPQLAFGMVEDITERKRAEEELRFQKTLLECQIEASIDGILVVGGDKKWLTFNRRFVEMWGFPRRWWRLGQARPRCRRWWINC